MNELMLHLIEFGGSNGVLPYPFPIAIIPSLPLIMASRT